MRQFRVQVLIAAALAVGATAIVTAQQSTARRKEVRVQQSQAGGQVSGTASGSAYGSASSGGSISIRGGSSGQSGGFGFRASKPTYAVWYEIAPGVTDQSAISAANLGHTQYMEALSKNQTLVIEGVFTDSSGFMAVIQADTPQLAEQIIKADPGVSKGVLKATFRPWQPRYTMSGGRPATGSTPRLAPNSAVGG